MRAAAATLARWDDSKDQQLTVAEALEALCVEPDESSG
jgi:hypothetical protein